MSLTADLTPAADPRVPVATALDRPFLRRRRTGVTGTSVVTTGDVVRLTATLAAVGALLAVLDLSAGQGPAPDGQRALETSYGVVALGHVRVEEVPGQALLEAAGDLQRVTVPVTLHNLSDEPVHYGPEHFRLRSGSATARPVAGSVRTGDVAPDGAVQLRLVFDLPPTSRARLTVDDARLSAGVQLRLPPVPEA